MQSLELLALSEVNQLCCSSSQMHIHKWTFDVLCFGMGGWDLGLDFVFHTTLALTLTLSGDQRGLSGDQRGLSGAQRGLSGTHRGQNPGPGLGAGPGPS